MDKKLLYIVAVVAAAFLVSGWMPTKEYKTKKIAAMLKALGADKKALIVLPTSDAKVVASAKNIPGVKTAIPGTLNAYDILKYDKFIVAKEAVAIIEEVYA